MAVHSSRWQRFVGRASFGPLIISIAVPVAAWSVIARAKDEGPRPKDDLLNMFMERSFGYRLHQQLIHTRVARRLDDMPIRVAGDHDDGYRLHLLIRQTPKRVNEGEAVHGFHRQIREDDLRLEFANRCQCRASVTVLGAFDPEPLQQPVQEHAHVLIVVNDNSAQLALGKFQTSIHDLPTRFISLFGLDFWQARSTLSLTAAGRTGLGSHHFMPI